MRTEILALELMNDSFMLQTEVLENFMEYLNDGMQHNPSMALIGKEANNSVTYEKIQHVAIISVDGAMYKKDMSGMCMSVASYQHIIKYAEVAEQDVEVTKILYRVTTPGGTVAGINPVEEAVTGSKKETNVLYEDLGASAGVYAFCGCDNRYATKGTEVGSIGAVAGFVKSKKGDKVEYITSSRAKNKVTDLESAEGKAKFQKKLDKMEGDFYGVVEKNTGLSAQQIEETFDSGSCIFAEDAIESGFLHGIITFKGLLAEMLKSPETNSGVNHSSVTASAQIKKPIEGNSMEKYTEESFKALELSHAEALTGVETKLTVATTALATMTADKETAVVALATLQTTVDAKNEVMPEIMAMAFKAGVAEDTLVKMAMVDTIVEAKAAVVDGMDSDGAFGAQKEGFSADTKVVAKADLKARCETLGVTFIGEK